MTKKRSSTRNGIGTKRAASKKERAVKEEELRKLFAISDEKWDAFEKALLKRQAEMEDRFWGSKGL